MYNVSLSQACGDFLAGDAVRSRSRYSALSETAIFGRACRHEFPKKFINMKHGERFKIHAFSFFLRLSFFFFGYLTVFLLL